MYLAGYDRLVFLFSGGKDSVAAVLYALEQGADPAKMELWHHVVDGREGSKLMDWPCTNAYCRAFAAAIGVPIYFSWKHGGFEGEMLREEARTQPISYEVPMPDGTVVVRTSGGVGGKLSTRRMFPQVSASLNVRWCSSYAKIHVGQAGLHNQERFKNSHTLLISGERAEESPGRAYYARFEVDATDARYSPKLRRHIDRWRAVHQWSEADVWEIIGRWFVNPHPAYRLGWSRCSCAGCIFNGPNEFATLRLINPVQFNRLADYEGDFERTIKRKMALNTLADLGTPFPVREEDVRAALAEDWTEPIILTPGAWRLPAGAFAGGAGPS